MKAPLLDYYFSRLVPKSFGGLIDVHKATVGMNNKVTSTSYFFKVPEKLCLSSTNGISVMTISTIIALFDEFSSASLMYLDSKNRPGVSILLSADLYSSCESGSIVEFISVAKKIGTNIAFCDIKMLSDNVVLAQGQHIKYMPMGILWDIFCNKYTLPLSLWIVKSFQKVPDSDDLSSLTSGNCTIVSDIFKLTPTTEMGVYEVQITTAMANVMGNTHGGALAMTAEKSAALALTDAGLRLPNMFIQSLQTKYLSAVKAPSVATVVCKHITGQFGVQTVGEIYTNKSRLCVQFEAKWGQRTN